MAEAVLESNGGKKLAMVRTWRDTADLTVASTTFTNWIDFGLINIPAGGVMELSFNDTVQSTVAGDTVGYRVQDDGVDVGITPRIADARMNGTSISESVSMSVWTFDDVAAGVSRIILQANRSSGTGTVTSTYRQATMKIWVPDDVSNAAQGMGASAENLNDGTLAGGGSVLDQRGTVQPVRPYR